MARPLIIVIGHPVQYILSSSTPVAFFCLVVAILSVFSVVTFLCASQKTTKPKRSSQNNESSGHKKLISSNSNSSSNYLSSKAVLMVKMISFSWKKIEVEEEEEEDDDDNEAVVWKKSIIMGERCRPLEFSGKIVYDSQGNLVPAADSKSKSHLMMKKSGN